MSVSIVGKLAKKSVWRSQTSLFMLTWSNTRLTKWRVKYRVHERKKMLGCIIFLGTHVTRSTQPKDKSSPVFIVQNTYTLRGWRNGLTKTMKHFHRLIHRWTVHAQRDTSLLLKNKYKYNTDIFLCYFILEMGMVMHHSCEKHPGQANLEKQELLPVSRSEDFS